MFGLKIKINNSNDDIIQNYYKKNDGCNCMDLNSSGLDIMMPEDITIPAKSYGFKINLGISCEPIVIYSIEENLFGSSKSGYYLYPRSSLSKTNLRKSNSIGVIDSGYRGQIIAAVDNFSDEDVIIKKGERLFQLCSHDLKPIHYIISNELSKTERGSGGFGSTGK